MSSARWRAENLATDQRPEAHSLQGPIDVCVGKSKDLHWKAKESALKESGANL